jgi:transcriptional regulator GlxA family with amidase domain
LRLERARSLLDETPDLPLKQLAAAVGFKTASYFSRLYEQRYGQHPHAGARHLTD